MFVLNIKSYYVNGDVAVEETGDVLFQPSFLVSFPPDVFC
jgi:hypothetical protein